MRFLLRWNHQVLLQLTVRHRVRRHPHPLRSMRKLHRKYPERHPSPQFLRHLPKARRLSSGFRLDEKSSSACWLKYALQLSVKRERSIFPCCKSLKTFRACASAWSAAFVSMPSTSGVSCRAMAEAAEDASWFVNTAIAALSSGKTMFSETNPETSPECSSAAWPIRGVVKTPRP